MSIKIIKAGSNNYPERLTHLHNLPDTLHIVGDFGNILNGKTLGVVGSRKISSYGRNVTTELSYEAARAGLAIVSGLALGVDSVAHRAALDASGKTIAVLPGGIKKIYPPSHRELARNIVQKGGALVSEYSGKKSPMRHNFIERNRIIAALSDALLIPEAAEKSGSLHTASFALELGRPVLAVPGNITSPTSSGTNNLIKIGAAPVTSIKDVMEALDFLQDNKFQQQELYGDNDSETILLQLIKEGNSEGNRLLALSEMSVETFQRHLSMLEIKGRIRSLGNDQWSLK